LSIRPGYKTDPNTGARCCVGYPYGVIPRLLLFWMTTEVVRTPDRRLKLGDSLSGFMRELGLNPDNGGTGAKRSDARRLKDQTERLFRATISFDEASAERTRWLDMPVAPKGELWWDPQHPDQNDLFGSWIELGEDFYQALREAPVPVDMRTLRALKQSPLALDLYTWLAYRDKSRLEIHSGKGPVLLVVTAIDAAGNVSACELDICPPKGDDDDDL